MDRVDGLSDELLIKILSFLPTKVAVSTSILSKRWECLWRWLPKLEFVAKRCTSSEGERLRCFLDRNLSLHRAPVIESFCLKLTSPRFRSEDVKLFIQFAVSRHLRELDIDYHHRPKPEKANILPSCLYICKSLVSLTLRGHILLDVPRMVCLSSLKTLYLKEVEGLNGESLGRFLSISPVLEDLLVLPCCFLKLGKITINVQSLQSLILLIPYKGDVDELVIDTPSLKSLKLADYTERNYTRLFKHMPKLEKAYVNVNFPDIESLIRSITSVKRLSICSKAVYGGDGGDGFVFNQLEHLKLCVRREYSSILLIRFLQDSPNLRVLHLNNMKNHEHDDLDGLVCWNQPSTTVLNCMLSNLQTLSWSDYYGRPLERDIAAYVLKNARCLQTATISSNERFVPKFEMIKELSLSSRASTTCQLIFN